MLGQPKARSLSQSSVKLFSNNSNACDHNPPTSQTDGRTDRQLMMAIPRYGTLRAVQTFVVAVNVYQYLTIRNP